MTWLFNNWEIPEIPCDKRNNPDTGEAEIGAAPEASTPRAAGVTPYLLDRTELHRG